MRALWAASTAAITVSALVGVLLGAYLHEQRVNARLTGTDKAPVTSVHIEFSTITVLPTALQSRLSESDPPTAELVTRDSEETPGPPEPSLPRLTPETTATLPSATVTPTVPRRWRVT